jgi:hypothetical protein
MPIGIGQAILGAGVLGAGASIFGSASQVGAEEQAIAAQKQMYQTGLGVQSGYLGQASNLLSPYANMGQAPLGLYNYLTGATTTQPGGTTAPAGMTSGSLTAPFTAATLASTPGYQFTLGQGLKSTQNSFAAQGLGSSGAALKGAASYGTGLAQNTYNQQFSNYLAQNQQIGNMFLQGGQVGEAAGAAMAGIYGGAGNAALGGGVQTGQGIASSTAGIGNALAGGAAGVANSASSTTNSLMQYQLLQSLLGNNLGQSVNAYNTNTAGSMDAAIGNYNAYNPNNPFTGD